MLLHHLCNLFSDLNQRERMSHFLLLIVCTLIGVSQYNPLMIMCEFVYSFFLTCDEHKFQVTDFIPHASYYVRNIIELLTGTSESDCMCQSSEHFFVFIKSRCDGIFYCNWRIDLFRQIVKSFQKSALLLSSLIPFVSLSLSLSDDQELSDLIER